MSFSRDLSSFLFRRSLVVLVVSAVVLGGCSDGSEEPAEVSKTVEVSAEPNDADVAADDEVVDDVAPIPFDEFDPSVYEVGDVVPEVEVVEPVEYPEMAHNDEAGAKAAAQYMIDVLNYTYNTGDFTYLDEIAADDCSVCDNTKLHYGGLLKEKVKPTGAILSAQKISVEHKGVSGWVLNTTIDYIKAPVLDSQRRLKGFLASEGTLDDQMVLRTSGDKWQLVALGESAN